MRSGLIPAHAGKTAPRKSRPQTRGAHPRSRGENNIRNVNGQEAIGSSPLTRGKQALGGIEYAQGGLIPAHAGKTTHRQEVSAPQTAHPRSRGENRQPAPASSFTAGSSPLTRGKREAVNDSILDERLIPAHAGKTTARQSPPPTSWAHPRSRGENLRRCVVDAVGQGSSPLTRGKLGDGTIHGHCCGLIPAHAGKT